MQVARHPVSCILKTGNSYKKGAGVTHKLLYLRDMQSVITHEYQIKSSYSRRSLGHAGEDALMFCIQYKSFQVSASSLQKRIFELIDIQP